MMIASARWLAFAVLTTGAAALGGPGAAAQALPGGSYQRSCTDIHWAGTTLVAECRRADGKMTGTGLANANRCVGDIGNDNGRLRCNYAGGAPSSPSPAPPRNPPPAPGYGGPAGPGYGGGGPGPGYGPPPAYSGRDDRRTRCDELWHRRQELRDRLQYTPWGPEHDRLEYRLRENRDDRERLGCGG